MEKFPVIREKRVNKCSALKTYLEKFPGKDRERAQRYGKKRGKCPVA